LKKIITAIIVGVCACCAAANSGVTNYSAPVTANAFLQWGDTLWVATSGGIVLHNLGNGAREFVGNGRIFPDLHLTSLCRDEAGNIWLGSRRGYLYKRSPRGQYTVFSTYKLSGWGITSLCYYDGMVVVGADKGVSLFDPAKGVAVRNAMAIARFSDPRVNAIAMNGDTLFLGCAEGVAYLDGLYSVPLAQRNFYDPGIWKTKGTGLVRSFVDVGDSVAAFPRPAALFRGYIYMVDADTAARVTWTNGGETGVARVVSEGDIFALYGEGDRRLWLGTEAMYYYSLGDGDPPLRQYPIDGYSLKQASRVVVAQNGDAWALPSVTHPNVFWYHGVHRFDGSGWRSYGSHNFGGDFGYSGDNNALGAAFWKDGSIWVGTWGGNIKHIDPAKNTVGQFIVGNRDFAAVSYLYHGRGDNRWGKCDAVAADSSGYLWFSVYDSELGSLVCYDPRYIPVSWEANPAKAHFRRFFTEPPLKVQNIEFLAVNREGRLFAYGGNRLVAFSHGGNPLSDGIKVDTVYESIGTLRALEIGPDGALYMAGAGGIKKIKSGATAVEILNGAFNAASCMAVDDGVLWLGTSGGIIKYDMSSNKETMRIDEAFGLSSNNVVSVAIDRKNGRLWLATDEGVSMIDVGRSGRNAARPPLRAVPNLYSASGISQGATQIIFHGLKPKSSVSVYAVNGVLAAKVEARYHTDTEWRAAWTPKKNIVPGTYIAVVKPGGERAKIIIKP
jgi:ligand-binding sensor domain-containing protein